MEHKRYEQSKEEQNDVKKPQSDLNLTRRTIQRCPSQLKTDRCRTATIKSKKANAPLPRRDDRNRKPTATLPRRFQSNYAAPLPK
jgi:hypothetical protein